MLNLYALITTWKNISAKQWQRQITKVPLIHEVVWQACAVCLFIQVTGALIHSFHVKLFSTERTDSYFWQICLQMHGGCHVEITWPVKHTFSLMNQFIMGKKYICEWSVSRAAFHIICYALSSLTSLCLIDSDVRHWLCYTSAHY